MARDGREMIRWMSSRLNHRSFGKALVTAYIARDQGRDRQYIDVCIRTRQRDVVIAGCFDVGRAAELAKPIFYALNDAIPLENQVPQPRRPERKQTKRDDPANKSIYKARAAQYEKWRDALYEAEGKKSLTQRLWERVTAPRLPRARRRWVLPTHKRSTTASTHKTRPRDFHVPRTRQRGDRIGFGLLLQVLTARLRGKLKVQATMITRYNIVRSWAAWQASPPLSYGGTLQF